MDRSPFLMPYTFHIPELFLHINQKHRSKTWTRCTVTHDAVESIRIVVQECEQVFLWNGCSVIEGIIDYQEEGNKQIVINERCFENNRIV